MSGESAPIRRKLRKVYNVPGDAHELTFTCAHKLKMLSGDRARDWFIESLKAARLRYGFKLWAYVIMPEHAHVLLHPAGEPVERIQKAIKQSVARKAVGVLRSEDPEWLERLRVTWPSGREEYRFWMQGAGYDRNIICPTTAWKSIEYIHRNPVRRGLVQNALDWPWSSARSHAGHADALIAVDQPPPRL